MMLTANSTNEIDFNRPNTNPLSHRDLLHPKKLTSRLASSGPGTTQDSSHSSDSNSIYRQKKGP